MQYLKDLVKISRFDHWIKNVIIIPGFFLGTLILDVQLNSDSIKNLLLALLSTCLASSSNYVVNEYIDRNSDKYHPIKQYRVGADKNNFGIKAIVILYLVYFLSSLYIAYFVSKILFLLIVMFIVSALIYNVPPIRMKDKPVGDIYLESLNSPIRFIIGWVAVESTSFPPLSTIFFFLFGGAFLMTAKRISELNLLRNSTSFEDMIRYRRSFKFYTPEILFFILQLNSGLAITFLSIFTMKYNPDFLFYVLIVTILFAMYLKQTVGNEIHVTEKPHYIYKDKFFIFMIIIGVVIYYLVLRLNIDIFSNILKSNELKIDFLSRI